MQGYINMIVQERNWVTVEGLNCEYVKMGESRDFPGMMIKVEKPLLVTTDIRNQFNWHTSFQFSAVQEPVGIPVPVHHYLSMDLEIF
jgi:hypothetical protein